MNIELANGSEGYIPPPEQHALGGYTTWPARTAGLEVQAEPKIVAALLGLLEQVAGRPRRALSLIRWPVCQGRPGFEADGLLAARRDRGNHRDRFVRPRSPRCALKAALPFTCPARTHQVSPINSAVHFAGGFLETRLDDVPETYTLELWFWNGLPNDAREITGVLYSLSVEKADPFPGEYFGLSGKSKGLSFYSGPTDFVANADPVTIAHLSGKTEIAPKTWHHVALVRSGKRVAVYLDGRSEIDASDTTNVAPVKNPGWLRMGGRMVGNHAANFEGKLDEVALYDRALSADEIAGHVRAARSR